MKKAPATKTKSNSVVKYVLGASVLLGVLVLLVPGNSQSFSPSSSPTLPTDSLPSSKASPAPAPAPAPKLVQALSITPDRVIILNSEVNSVSASKIISELGRLNSEGSAPIYLLIHSPGGSVFDGAMVISAMESSKAPVNTICMGICASMAAQIHQYGVKRLALDRAILMFHPASGGAQGEVDKMYSRLSFVKNYVGKMDANIARRSGLSDKELNALTQVEFWIEAEDAKNKRIVDEVVAVKGIDYSSVYGFSLKGRNMDILIK